LDNDDRKRIASTRVTAAQFARMSSSMQLTLIAIRRAQRSSRKALAVKTYDRKPQVD
jgi:hypothetical protein